MELLLHLLCSKHRYIQSHMLCVLFFCFTFLQPINKGVFRFCFNSNDKSRIVQLIAELNGWYHITTTQVCGGYFWCDVAETGDDDDGDDDVVTCAATERTTTNMPETDRMECTSEGGERSNFNIVWSNRCINGVICLEYVCY